MQFRTTITTEDAPQIRQLVSQTNVFSPEEVDTAEELLQETLQFGVEKTGYHFVFLEDAEHFLGYSCYGLIPLTAQSYDLYWIAVSPRAQQRGLAQKILQKTEECIRKIGGQQLHAETSGTPAYAAARAFYLKNGFIKAATFKDFYKAGDDKVMFVKYL